jgi:hypothetical protein
MMRNITAGITLALLIIMGLIAYAQRHEGCLRGRSIETFRPCGSVDSSL